MTGVHVIVAGTEREARELRDTGLRVPDCSAVVVLSIRTTPHARIRSLIVHSWAMTEHAIQQDRWSEVAQLLTRLVELHRDAPAQWRLAHVGATV
jgi:hypothetical protein